ncbi:hypothetical protein CN931_16330 [Bacillus sp. AFS054943]|nr:hypothetical protein CN402_15370 [Bacillus sp. AFS015896]PGL81754.1 hypothetical protein CN931_16330 [Bacillus sp. AFS054943]
MENKSILKGGLFILNELSKFNIIYRAESHHDLIGHMLTYSHAINIMYDLGHVFKFSYSYFDYLKRAPEYKDITLEKFCYIINS